jgi:hypothetical protein
LSKDSLAIHFEGQVVKIIQHFINSHRLLPNKITVFDHNGNTYENMKVFCLVMRPTCFPHAQQVQVMKLSLETKQQPAMTEE